MYKLDFIVAYLNCSISFDFSLLLLTTCGNVGLCTTSQRNYKRGYPSHDNIAATYAAWLLLEKLCHWYDNLAGKDSISFQSQEGQIMLQSPKLKQDKDV
ncbi:hypothetical protein NIES2101_38505 [Calothrix sp. HK-06]|nr:hypothetical protein NIES2101_38505 [Calothrix sp. HK-06]